ncbi:MAG: cobalt-precorrin-5B (C(1))-methyltransferase [Alphaproteobacteria bacterium]|jgi:cobalt-precorrin-5B (C1)-methyltransferase|nr:cobalt-precorrin-5B (C(1))-methyltransferase [Alphaproteobacteria bacterium]HJP23221.1 cobalt-precorrin-5B (C(1))-methyltransferase [Alphaproteobacteria bacterium]
MSSEPERSLRRGWTTGACATAATRAAYTALLGDGFPDPVTITLPGGQRPAFALAREALADESATAGIVKDAGDDPDVTHGALVLATVRRSPAGSGIVFRAGPGVGTVTLPGLALAVGEPAINPVPRSMMVETVNEVAAVLGEPADVEITISIENGEALAARTMNGRLGIKGGLSVLGTTGIVIPYSCAAWIASIRQGVDVARAGGFDHVAASTGSTSEAAVKKRYGLSDEALIEMGDFAGGLLKYLRQNPVPRLTIAGGFGKLVKLGQGSLDLHSGRSQVDFAWLAEGLAELGAATDMVARARQANTAAEVLEMARGAGLGLGDWVAARAGETARRTVGGEIDIEILVFDRTGQLVGSDG